MGWFDDAKKKAEQTRDKAKEQAAEKLVEAQTEAAKRVASAALAEAGRRVSGFFEGFVSSAEDALEEARAERGLDADGNRVEEEDDEDPAEVEAPAAAEAEPEPEPEPEGPSAAERALAELQRLKAERGPRPPPTPAPEPDPVPEPEPVPAAPPEPAAPVDPFADALAALERSRAAREGAKVNRRAQAREDAARDELARLKAALSDGEDD